MYYSRFKIRKTPKVITTYTIDSNRLLCYAFSRRSYYPFRAEFIKHANLGINVDRKETLNYLIKMACLYSKTNLNYQILFIDLADIPHSRSEHLWNDSEKLADFASIKDNYKEFYPEYEGQLHYPSSFYLDFGPTFMLIIKLLKTGVIADADKKHLCFAAFEYFHFWHIRYSHCFMATFMKSIAAEPHIRNNRLPFGRRAPERFAMKSAGIIDPILYCPIQAPNPELQSMNHPESK